jgi:hypothetical protein
VTFSDGTPLDAKAVKTAYDGIIKLGPLAALGATYLSGYQETKVLAPNKLEVDFSTANAAFLQATATTTLGILSPKSYDIDPKKRALGDFVGSGPFTLKGYKVAQSVKLAKRKDYAWGSEINENRKAAHIDALDVTFVPEESVLVGQGVDQVAVDRAGLDPEVLVGVEVAVHILVEGELERAALLDRAVVLAGRGVAAATCAERDQGYSGEGGEGAATRCRSAVGAGHDGSFFSGG